MKQLNKFISLFFLLIVVPLAAQIHRGDKFYEAGEYNRAIPSYERGLRKTSDAQAMENLANCYRITKNYVKAEEWYAKTIAANPGCNAMVYFNYGVALRNNGKNAEAKKEFTDYLAKDPSNKFAESQVQ